MTWLTHTHFNDSFRKGRGKSGLPETVSKTIGTSRACERSKMMATKHWWGKINKVQAKTVFKHTCLEMRAGFLWL